MGLVKDISNLLVREFVLELRQAYAINSILLYLGSVVFICYLSMGLGAFVPGPVVWNALFWIVLLFVSVNGVAKSFMLEGRGRQLYYYVLASPLAIILSKMVYNSLLTIVLAFAGLGFYALIMGNPVANMGLFMLNMTLAAIGFSGVLTLTSGIAARARNSATIMSILSFPVIIPILLMCMRISKQAIDGLEPSLSHKPLIVLAALDVLVIMTATILFPYLWRS